MELCATDVEKTVEQLLICQRDLKREKQDHAIWCTDHFVEILVKSFHDVVNELQDGQLVLKLPKQVQLSAFTNLSTQGTVIPLEPITEY